MPRKKVQSVEVVSNEPANSATAVAEPRSSKRPEFIDGPPVNEDGSPVVADQSESRKWADPFKALVTTALFEMGEDRRFKQRVFKFKEKPSPVVLAALKESGFVYRAGEKAWTIPANPDTRRLSEELAEEFGGQLSGHAR